jgi:hypothetical protein
MFRSKCYNLTLLLLTLAAEHWSTTSTQHLMLGKHLDSMETRKIAVDIYRHLHAEQPRLFAANLARELSHWSKIMGDLGRHKEAFDASREASALYRQVLGVPGLNSKTRLGELPPCACECVDDSQERFGKYEANLTKVHLPKANSATFYYKALFAWIQGGKRLTASTVNPIENMFRLLM